VASSSRVEAAVAALPVMAAVVACATVLADPGRMPWGLDGPITDALARHVAPEEPGSQAVTIVLVDDESLVRLGARWPLPRSLWAEFLDKVTPHAPAAVALDAWFETPAPTDAVDLALEISDELRMMGLDQQPGGDYVAARLEDRAARLDGDRQLSEALARRGRVVLGTACATVEADVLNDSDAGVLAPLVGLSGDTPAAVACARVATSIPPLAIAAADQGSLHIPPDLDGVTRRYPLWHAAGDARYPSLALAAVRVARPEVTAAALAGPLGRTDGVVVPRPSAPEAWDLLRFSDVLEAPDDAPALAGAFRDRLVLVGVSAQGTEDAAHLPRAVAAPGVLVHAAAARDLLEGRLMDTHGAAPRVGIAAAIAGLLGLAALGLVPSTPVLLAAGLGAALAWSIAVATAFHNGVLLPISAPLGGIGGWLVVRGGFAWRRLEHTRRRAADLRQAFQQYVAPEVVEELLAHPGRLRLGGKRRVVTAFFSDLKGFTALSEHMDPADLVRLLNRHLGVIADTIVEEGGIVDKFVGDAVVAIFGAPVEHPDHAARAVRAALRCQARMQQLAAEERAAGRAPLTLRIGLNTGQCVVGNLGSAQRFDYTMLGDTVNLAARLEGVNNVYETGILVGEATRDACPDLAFREVDAVRVKGRQQAVRLFEPLRETTEPTDLAARTAAALAAWRAGDWGAALPA
jgi:adenylate cyclase